MKISYQILCKNEDKSLDKLLSFLTTYKDSEDEINICRDKLGENKNTIKILEKYKEQINFFEREITHTIHNQKNYLATKAKGDYLFYLDADELLEPKFIKNIKIILKNNSNVDIFFLPRINIVKGLTEDYAKSRGWKIDSKNRINWPDIQDRLFKHKKGIKYKEIPHGRLINYKTKSIFPLEDIYAIYHEKSMEKQQSDNSWHDNKEKELGLRK